MNERDIWIDIIAKKYTDLHMSDRVMHVSKESDKKRARILKYFDRLEKLHQKVIDSKSTSAINYLKNLYYDLYVIKPENIPESYFLNGQRIYRERGYGNVELTLEQKEMLINQIIDDQKKSLEKWIDYFLFDEESNSYEIWEKYWVFQGLQELGKYDKEKGKFTKRDKTTVYPFPPVDREAIFTTINLMEEYIKNKESEDEIKKFLGEGNFKILYEYSIRQIRGKKYKSASTEGVWIKYDQGSDYNLLRDSLKGHYTGWCTAAGENFAKSQIGKGDFYVYYTMDENNEPKVPRIAIRMNGNRRIAEIRGIANNQNLEAEMLPILNKKLEEFPDSDNYYKKEHDMHKLTAIDNKRKNGFELNPDELRFLYEIDNKIEGFGYKADPRIKEIMKDRNKYQDLAKIFNCKVEEIGDKATDIDNPNIKVFLGGIYLDSLKNAESLVLPETAGVDIDLYRLTNAEGLILPETVCVDIDLGSLKNAEGLVFPKVIYGDLNLNNLNSVKGLVLPKVIAGNLYLNGIKNAEGLVLPEVVCGDIALGNLISAEGLVLPETIKGALVLTRLKISDGLVLPEIVGGNILLSRLKRAKNLVLPKKIGGCLDLTSLTCAKGLVLPNGFDIKKILCNENLKKEICNNLDKYYCVNEIDDYKRTI